MKSGGIHSRVGDAPAMVRSPIRRGNDVTCVLASQALASLRARCLQAGLRSRRHGAASPPLRVLFESVETPGGPNKEIPTGRPLTRPAGTDIAGYPDTAHGVDVPKA